MSICVRPIAVPAILLQIEPGRHPHKSLNLLQPLHRIHHLIARFVFLDQPIDQRVDLPPIFRADIGGVVIQVLEVVVLFEHRCFVDVVVGGNAVVVSVFGELSDVLQVVAADIDVEKHQVAIDVLLPQDVFQILLRGNKCFGQAGLQIPRVQSEVDDSYASIAQAVCEIRLQ